MTPTTRLPALQSEAVAAYLAANPQSRASGPTCWDRVTGCRRIARCVICGSTHSESGKWGPTVHMADWRHEHALHTAAELRASIARNARIAAERALFRRYQSPRRIRAADRPAIRAIAALGLPDGPLGGLPRADGHPIIAVLARRGPLARVVIEHRDGRAERRWVEIAVTAQVSA